MHAINQYECFMKKTPIMHNLSSKRQTSKASETQYIFTYEQHWYFQHASFTTRPSTDKTCSFVNKIHSKAAAMDSYQTTLRSIHHSYLQFRYSTKVDDFIYCVSVSTTMHISPQNNLL